MKQKQRKTVFWIVVAVFFATVAGVAEWLIWPDWWILPLSLGITGTFGLIGWSLFKFEKWANKPDPEQTKTA
jgi:hypothetical protein